jgi:ribulose bisphosphate carboxylase small subunit-like protein
MAHQLATQIQYLLNEGLVPAIEYVRQPDPHDHYWGMWKLPLFQTRTAEDVLTEIQAWKAAHPDCFIKLIGLRPPAAFAFRRRPSSIHPGISSGPASAFRRYPPGGDAGARPHGQGRRSCRFVPPVLSFPWRHPGGAASLTRKLSPRYVRDKAF